MTGDTEKRLEDIKNRYTSASTGTWSLHPSMMWIMDGERYPGQIATFYRKSDLVFCLMAHEDIPYLVDLVHEKDTIIQRLQKSLSEITKDSNQHYPEET